MAELDRRTFLKTGALGAAVLGAGWPGTRSAAAHALAAERATKRVILVAFAGGVRSRETLATPTNVPSLKRLADEGVVYPRTRAANLGHFGATLSILTGIAEARGIRENARGEDPTLFEYVRKDLGFSPSEVWISTSGGAQESNLAYSLHPDYGAPYGANALDGDGIFNAEFKGILDAYGQPREMGEQERILLDRMRAAIVDPDQKGSVKAVNTAETCARVEQFLLDELKRGTLDLRGMGASDAKALRVARNLLAVFRPRLLGVVLRDVDVAHANFNSYVEVIRRNDAMLGELWAAVKKDPELRDTTSIFVLPEFGRDADLNSRRGLDHGDGSDELNYVSIVAWGPGFRRGTSVQEEVRTIDVCNTVCDLLGADPRFARGRRLPKLLA